MENKPQSERAHELAGFVRGYAIANAPSFGDYAKSRYKNSSWQCAYEHLADEIESLGEQDGLPYPLDKDGIPIKFGDTIYYCGIQNKVVGFKYYDECEYPDEGILVDCRDEDGMYNAHFAQYFTHKPPRTLNDILQDVPSNSFYGVQTWDTVNNLIQEAYDLGLSDGAKKNE